MPPAGKENERPEPLPGAERAQSEGPAPRGKAAVAAVLQKALGAFIEGIDADSLRASIWNGDVVLRGLSLKTSALEALQLPVRVLAGSLGEVRVQVPWRKLRSEPIVISIELVAYYALAEAHGLLVGGIALNDDLAVVLLCQIET